MYITKTQYTTNNKQEEKKTQFSSTPIAYGGKHFLLFEAIVNI